MAQPRTYDKSANGTGVLIAASLLAAVLGSVHAFSVFLFPLEVQFDQSRAQVSLTYSLALVSLTLAVLWGHHVYARIRPSLLVLGICLLAVLGVGIARHASTLWQVWFGYSIIFGAANGLGYGFGLQISAQANPDRKGVAMGCVTAAYAFGAVIAPALFSAAGGFRAAMLGLAGVLIVIGILCATLMHISRASFRWQDAPQTGGRVSARILVLFWIGYGASVATGLMVIGHAAGLSQSVGVTRAHWIAPVFVAICNLVGSLLGGKWADSVLPARLLTGLPMVSALAAIALAVLGSVGGAFMALGVIGFAYGGTIAAYPVIIAKLYEGAEGVRIYGRIFTAWGAAGLFAPWLAGVLYDLSGGYQTALIVAAMSGLASCAAILLLFRADRNLRK